MSSYFFTPQIVLDNAFPITPVTMVPFAPPEEVTQIRVYCKPEDGEYIGMQILEVIVCQNSK